MAGGTSGVQDRGAAQSGDASTGPIPGGNLTLPEDQKPMKALIGAVTEMADLPPNQRGRYLQLIVQQLKAETGKPPQAGQTISLPSLAELEGVAGASPATGTAAPVDRMVAEGAAKPQPIEDAPSVGTGRALENRGGATVSVRGRGRTDAAGTSRVNAETSRPRNVAVAARNLEAAFQRGDANAIFEILHGRSKEDQTSIITAFNARPFAKDVEVPILQGNFLTPGGLLGNWVQKKIGATRTQHNTFEARVGRMGDREQARVTAYRENDGSQLLPADKLYLSMRGGGSYEEGIFRQLRNLPRAEIEQQAILYAQRYHNVSNPTAAEAVAILQDDIEGELSGTDEVKALLYLRGNDQVTPADRQALELYSFGAGTMGTEEEPIFRMLEGKSGDEIKAVAAAYENLPGVDDTLFNDLDGEFDGIWYSRLEAGYQGNDAPSDTRAKYVAHSAQLYLSGAIEWEDMSRILTANIDPTGENGPTVDDVEKMFNAAGYWGDMTDRMGRHGPEVAGLVAVLEAGDSVKDSPAAKAVRLYHLTVGKSGTDEKAVCELLAGTTPGERRAIDREFRIYAKRTDGKDLSVEQAIRDDFSDTPAWMDRALDHWNRGALPAESIIHHVAQGAGTDAEALRALANVPASERVAIGQRYEAQYGSKPRAPATDAPVATDLTAGTPVGGDQRYDRLVEQLEKGFRAGDRRGEGLNGPSGQTNMQQLTGDFAVQLGVDILRTSGEEGFQALVNSNGLENQIYAGSLRRMVVTARTEDCATTTFDRSRPTASSFFAASHRLSIAP